MRVIHINYSDIDGGAARAAYRIHHCLRDAGVDSRMWVTKATAGDWTVHAPTGSIEKGTAALRTRFASLLVSTLKTANPIIHTAAVMPTKWLRRINQSDADVVHLHWVGWEMISIADIGRIEKPVLWTLHDMWAFCGAEHYTEDERWREGYTAKNRPAYESGFDLNRWTWERKRRNWTRPMHVVAPSHWLADCVRNSALMSGWPVHVVPNAIDTNRWRPLDQRIARDLLDLPQNVPLLLFGAIGGGRDPRKGFDLLLAALDHLRSDVPRLELLVFGERAPREPPGLGFRIHYTGHLNDDLSLRALYSAADMLVVSSRQDNLPNTAVEAHACGLPVVAFRIGGLPDIVEHKYTGYLADPFSSEELAHGIHWILHQGRAATLGENARTKALEQFSCAIAAARYEQLYAAIV
jgi:glycosyltransferase involved in cell wall biosynthesis